MLDNIKFGTYIFFAAFCLLMFLWVTFLVPETKNRTLEEMDQVFKDNAAAADAERMGRIRREIGLEREGEGEGEGGEKRERASWDEEKGESPARV